jgi:hypothetical protein
LTLAIEGINDFDRSSGFEDSPFGFGLLPGDESNLAMTIERRRLVIVMSEGWDKWLYDRKPLAEYYSVIPKLESAAIHSVHFDRLGSTLTFRIECTEFPDRPREEWVSAGCDRLEFQLRFLDAPNVQMRWGRFPDRARISFYPAPQRRVAVEVLGEECEIRFSSSDQLHAGRMNAYKASNPGIRYHASPIPRRLCAGRLPDPTVRWYYEKL